MLLLYASALVALLHVQGSHETPSPHAPRQVEGLDVPAGFSYCLFYDNFSDTGPGSLPSPSRWTVDLGTSYPGGPQNWGTAEVQTYTADGSNVEITADNTLIITPVRSESASWTSARMETTADWDFACKPGQRLRVEAKIRLGDGPESRQQGIWAAFWALGSDLRGNYWNWPGVGEIDILESVNGESAVRYAVHCGVAPGGPCNEPSGIGSKTDSMERGAWLTLAWEIDRRYGGGGLDYMSWYVDDVPRWTLRESDVNDDNAWEALAGNRKMLLLNVAVGGAFPDAVAGVKTPTEETAGGAEASMEVDYVAVYAGW